MTTNATTYHGDVDACADAIIERVGPRVVFGSPLALGRPAHIVNALYRRAAADRGIQLTILGGLSIARPKPSRDLERRFVEPLVERLFGDFPELEYIEPYARGTLPPNVDVSEFFLRAGAFMHATTAQQEYISSNYTHVGRDLLIQGLNVFGQCVARRSEGGRTTFSLSSNGDALDILPQVRARAEAGAAMINVCQVNQRLPFMPHDAEVPEGTFDVVLDDRGYDHALLGTPSLPIGSADYAIGLNASTLVRDGGTLQIGIGSLGDAIAYACCLRHEQGDVYREALDSLGWRERWGPLADSLGGTGPFETGLYGASEMFTDGFRHLMERGVLRREVYDDLDVQTLVDAGRLGPGVGPGVLGALVERGAVAPVLGEADVAYLRRFGILADDVRLEGDELVRADGTRLGADLGQPESLRAIEATCLGDRMRGGVVLHGGFYLGPPGMYEALHAMGDAGRQRINMTGIQFINELFGHEALATVQRRHARFMNSVMMMSALGAATSDGLESGTVVSGVGGQYNFVAQAHALPDARSVLMLRAAREKGAKVTSNIVWHYGHTTIPRHLRDVVITEYGVADLRGKRDREVVAALVEIADSRFQESLVASAKEAGKLPSGYRLPEHCRDNTPERIERALAGARARGCLPRFAFGSELTSEELVLSGVLKGLAAKASSKAGLARMVVGAVDLSGEAPEAARPYLARLGLDAPSGLQERMLQRLVVSELRAGGHL